ncbi:MAG: dipeptidase [Planctomycetia bacterium]|nr:dipeptidase [Planctomycetia bacterium]
MSEKKQEFSIQDYLNKNKEYFEHLLFELLRFPSVSAVPEHHQDCCRTAEWLERYFQKMGLSTKLIETDAHPLIYAETPVLEGAPTVMIYGHYDVQPTDPISEWETEPFLPTVRDGYVYARGASDDKGPLLSHILAVEYWMKSSQKLNLNWKFFIEGDEECGNGGTQNFVSQNSDLLACDYIVLSDSPQFAPGQPAITCGLRGNVYYQLDLTGANQDLHSGMFGGAITNPCNALTKILSKIQDENGQITVPEFYDDVQRITPERREQLEMLPFEEDEFYASVGVKEGFGETGFSVLERRWLRPSFDIHGLTGGYQGEGGKTVLPARASAKFSFRLVPDQDPQKITRSLNAFLQENCPPGIQMKLTSFGEGAGGLFIDTSSTCMQAAVRALEFGFGRSPFFICEGGSIPIISTFAQSLTPNIIMIGLSQSSDHAHGPNEHFSLTDFHRGIKTSMMLWRELASLS